MSNNSQTSHVISSSLHDVQACEDVIKKFKKKKQKRCIRPSGVLNSMVSLSWPARPPFNTSTPAVIWEYGQSRLVWPDTDCDRRRRDGVNGTGGHGFHSLRMMSSVRFVERSPFFQNTSWFTFHTQPSDIKHETHNQNVTRGQTHSATLSSASTHLYTFISTVCAEKRDEKYFPHNFNKLSRIATIFGKQHCKCTGKLLVERMSTSLN